MFTHAFVRFVFETFVFLRAYFENKQNRRQSQLIELHDGEEMFLLLIIKHPPTRIMQKQTVNPVLGEEKAAKPMNKNQTMSA